jgi:hypothetical protein
MKWRQIHPNITQQDFTKTELASLVKTAKENGNRNWIKIAEEHSRGEFKRTAFQCFKAFKSILPQKRWSDDEIEEVKRWTLYYNELGAPRPFVAIASRMPGRNSSQVQHKCLALQSGKIGRWTKEEDELLLKAIEMFGERWSLVQTKVTKRTAPQCRDHYKNVLDPSINRDEFTPEQMNELLNLVAIHGEKWALIASQMVPPRTDSHVFYKLIQCRRVWISHMKEKYQDENSNVNVESVETLGKRKKQGEKVQKRRKRNV